SPMQEVLVPVYGLTADADGQPCYAMRFIAGESLQAACERFHRPGAPGGSAARRNLELRELLGHFVAACKTVAYAHSRGVLHRDLKPANVMLGPYGETLVVDWGLARFVGPADADEDEGPPGGPADGGGTTPGGPLGTPAFMSPEQAAGRWDEVGPASDVYSLGATLYVLLTGQPPVAAGSVLEVLERQRRGAFPPPRAVARDVPRPLEAICLKALALRPLDRYPTALALAGDVERYLAGEAVTAYRDP